MTSPTNLDRYRADLDRLQETGALLEQILELDVYKDQLMAGFEEQLGKAEAEAYVKSFPSFGVLYQSWYSEAGALIKQLLPSRYEDFRSHYSKPKGRKDINYESYRIEDHIQGLVSSLSGRVVADSKAAIPQLRAQTAILSACADRFTSSLHDIKQLVQADLFDSELDAARSLLKNGFLRAAGAMAGVVLEHHLQQVMENHSIKLTKKTPGLADFTQALKDGEVLDIPEWRRLMHLGDLRNKCDHKKAADPTKDEVEDLITGVERTTKTLF